MITTFGELMLRISPKEIGERILQATHFEIRPGGSESNVAIALSNLGEKCAFVTNLPANPLGQKINRQLQQESVDTKFINQTGNRIGMYWTENGTGPRNSFVIYDRDHSALSKAIFQDFDWDLIFAQTKWFHFSGISPAVSESVSQLLKQVVEKISCPYSVDLNFRNNLWNWVNKDPEKIKEVMTNLCAKANLIAGNESDFQNIFGLKSSEQNEKDAYTEIAKNCFNIFPKLEYIAISNRKAFSANHNDWNGFLFVKNDSTFCYEGLTYKLDNIQDRVGTGDSFSAGIIYGLQHQNEMTWQQIIDFAVTLGALNHTTKGDASNFNAQEVFSVAHSKGSGRIIR
jgi:2-dehydro-3-deoxygluconokinase